VRPYFDSSGIVPKIVNAHLPLIDWSYRFSKIFGIRENGGEKFYVR
jgi:hypothetical protein